jgi:hypothetical protein
MSKSKASLPARSYIDCWSDRLWLSLNDILVRGEFDDFGIFRLVNRVIFASTKQICFLVGHKFHNSHCVFLDRNISAVDPVFREPLREYIYKEEFADSKIKYLGEPDSGAHVSNIGKNTDNFTYRLFNSDYFVMCFFLEPKHTKPLCKPEFTFKPVDDSTSIGQLISRLYRNDKKEEFIISRGLRTYIEDDYLETKLRHLNTRNLSKKATLDDPDDAKNYIENDDEQVISLAKNAIQTIIHESFQRLYKSPSINRQNSCMSNTFIFHKVFDRRKRRYDDFYKYNCSLYLSDDQIKGIKQHLKKLAEDKSPHRAWMFSLVQKSEDDEFYKIDGKGIDEYFFSELANRPNKVIEIMTGPTPDAVRLFTENAFMSGSLMIKPDIFERSGIGWISRSQLNDIKLKKIEYKDNNGKDISGHKAYEGQRVLALKYLACFHYVLQLAYLDQEQKAPKPSEKSRNMSVVAYPFRCSGGIWMCAVRVRSNQSSETRRKLAAEDTDYGRAIAREFEEDENYDDADSTVICSKEMEKTASIYHSLYRETERRLRSKAKGVYIELCADILARGMQKTLSRHPEALHPFVLDEKNLEWVNTQLRQITRVIPFEQIKIIVKNSESKLYYMHELLLQKQDNSFFDRLTLHSFLNEKSVQEDIVKLLYSKVFGGFING